MLKTYDADETILLNDVYITQFERVKGRLTHVDYLVHNLNSGKVINHIATKSKATFTLSICCDKYMLLHTRYNINIVDIYDGKKCDIEGHCLVAIHNKDPVIIIYNVGGYSFYNINKRERIFIGTKCNIKNVDEFIPKTQVVQRREFSERKMLAKDSYFGS